MKSDKVYRVNISLENNKQQKEILNWDKVNVVAVDAEEAIKLAKVDLDKGFFIESVELIASDIKG